MMAFIRDWDLRNRTIDKFAEDFGVTLHFLPPFWSSCNPQEYIWAEVKKNYRKDTSDDPWEVKLQRAWDKITPEFREKCIARSIKFCLDMLKKIREDEVNAALVNNGADDAHSDSFSDNSNFEPCQDGDFDDF